MIGESMYEPKDDDQDLLEAIGGLKLTDAPRMPNYVSEQLKRTKMYEKELLFRKKDTYLTYDEIQGRLSKGLIPSISAPFVFHEPEVSKSMTIPPAIPPVVPLKIPPTNPPVVPLKIPPAIPSAISLTVPPAIPPAISLTVPLKIPPSITPSPAPERVEFKFSAKKATKAPQPAPNPLPLQAVPTFVFNTGTSMVITPAATPVLPVIDYSIDYSEFEEPNMFNVRMRKPCKLYEHQIEAVRWALGRESGSFHGISGGILALSVGLGKTIISLSTIMSTYQPGQTATLIITPKGLMLNYLMDSGKFFGTSIRGFILDREVDDKRFYGFTIEDVYKNHIIIMSVDTLTGLAKSIGKCTGKGNSALEKVARIIYDTQWFRVVCDESHRFSNHKTQLWEALKSLPRGRRLLLTGTVVRSYEDGIFAQLSVAGMNILESARQWTIQNFQEYKLRDALFVKSQAETTINLPPSTVEQVHVEFGPFELKVYGIMLANSRKIYQGFKEKDGTIFANVLEQFTRMRQACIALHLITPQSKSKRLTDGEKERLKDGSLLGMENIALERIIRQSSGPSGVESAKMIELMKIAKAIPPTEKLIVFSQWSSCCALATHVFTTNFGASTVLFADGELDALERDQTFQKFRLDPSVRFLCMTSIGSEGLTLTEANHMVIMEPGFTSFTNEQAMGRINRIGQTRPTFVYQLIAKNSVEHRMLKILAEKHDIKKVLLESGINTELIGKLFE